MSFHVYFAFSTGLSSSIHVPKGTAKRMLEQIVQTETALGITREVYNKETRWHTWPLVKKSDLTNEGYCRAAEKHNATVRWFYELLAECSKKPATKMTEELTPAKAAEFWLGLSIIDVPVGRWSSDYYRARMESLYESLRGRESEGVSFDAKALTEKQAAEVIGLLSQWLDVGDVRLDVVKGNDCLTSSTDGGHEWCSGCGAVDPDDIEEDEEECVRCKRKRKSPAAANEAHGGRQHNGGEGEHGQTEIDN